MSGPAAAEGVRLRPTMLSDLDFVLSVEQDPVHAPFITRWERTQHEGAVRFPDFRHFIVEAGEGGTEAAGFVILQGCRSPHHAIELKRMVMQRPGQGLGRACLRLLQQIAFRDLHAHRFWLDVRAHNTRAKALYDSEGFVEEGRLRECVRTEQGYDSLIVMAMLESDWRAALARRVAAGDAGLAAAASSDPRPRP